MHRRQYLKVSVATSASLVGGCSTNAMENTPGSSPTDDPRGPVRGGSAVDISVREVEEDGEVEYLESEDAVRFVSRYESTEDGSGAPEPVYDTTPFDQFAQLRCTDAAARRATDYVTNQLQLSKEALFPGVSNVDGGRVATVVVDTSSIDSTDSQEGDGGTEDAGVTFDSIVQTTPSSVAATYVLEGHEYETDEPIYVREAKKRIPL